MGHYTLNAGLCRLSRPNGSNSDSGPVQRAAPHRAPGGFFDRQPGRLGRSRQPRAETADFLRPISLTSRSFALICRWIRSSLSVARARGRPGTGQVGSILGSHNLLFISMLQNIFRFLSGLWQRTVRWSAASGLFPALPGIRFRLLATYNNSRGRRNPDTPTRLTASAPWLSWLCVFSSNTSKARTCQAFLRP